MQRLVVAFCACVALGWSTRAEAQAGAWIAGRAILDVDSSWGTGQSAEPGAGVTLGLDISNRWGLQLTFDLPKSHTTPYDNTFNDPVFGWERIAGADARHSPGWSALAAIHVWRTPRVHASMLVGVSNLDHRSASSFVIERMNASGGDVTSRTEYARKGSYDWGGLAFGGEVPVRIAGRLSLVPGIQVIWFPLSDDPQWSGVIRPSLSVRMGL
jgi:hypothetical protein